MNQIFRSRIFSFITLTAMAASLNACSNASLSELRTKEPTGSAFHTALSKHYLLLSEDEHDFGRYSNSQSMADKGLNAAYDKATPPESPADGAEFYGAKDSLTKSYAALDAILQTQAAKTFSEDTAKLQTLYDCWLIRVESRARKADIDVCQQQFYNHLALVRHKLQHAPKDKKEVKAAPLTATSYLVFFEWDKAILNTQALANLKKMAQDILSIKEPYELVVNGHTDTSGSAEYNRGLSQSRALSIKELLITFGVPEKIVNVFAFGESDPLIPTKDGVRERQNRRVEIFIE